MQYSPVLTQENKQMSCPESRKFLFLYFFSFLVHNCNFSCTFKLLIVNCSSFYAINSVHTIHMMSTRMNDSAYKSFTTITPLLQINIILMRQIDSFLKQKHSTVFRHPSASKYPSCQIYLRSNNIWIHNLFIME